MNITIKFAKDSAAEALAAVAAIQSRQPIPGHDPEHSIGTAYQRGVLQAHVRILADHIDTLTAQLEERAS